MRSKKVMTVWSVLVGFFCILCRDVCVCVTCLPVMIKHAAIIRKLGCIFFHVGIILAVVFTSKEKLPCVASTTGWQ